MFEKFQPAKADPILGLSKIFQADPRAEKIDLGVGVYKDDNGITPVMSSGEKGRGTPAARTEFESLCIACRCRAFP
jgi:aspartate/tyrosine/aromatic aminotransferase